MPLTKFQESLLVLTGLKTVMQNDLRVIKRYIHDEDVKWSLSNKMLIDICSFLEEYRRFNNYAKDNTYIRDTMKITAPAIKRLKSWSGIQGLRNTVLAHGFRDDNDQGKPTCLDKRYFDADIPTNYAEIMLLSEYCVYVISAFMCRHKEDHQLAISKQPSGDANVSRGIETLEDFNKDVEELQRHMFELDPTLKNRFGID
ncbi:hypothetical protein I3252_05300 [Psychrobacter sp. Ps4]|uniref:hypothetical protein n=1 Tax=Psychrobacter sp. Ps4 TaxID=2790958 RepID=UPI001EDF6BF4|nr:hypothetical protein [Psychrobacter sp. Ps4]MCG3808899.1 hypothetical protein [Psychrobacter sp. Ps4]